MTDNSYDRVVAVLETMGQKSRDVRQDRSMWQCPAHPDNNPSLEVKFKYDKVILACYAGCQNDDILAAMGLEWSDLFEGELPQRGAQESGALLVRSYLYELPNESPWFWVDRYFPKTFRQRLPGVEPVRDLADRDASKNLGLRRDGRMPGPIFYHAPRVVRAITKEPTWVWWLDGEKDVETAERDLGVVATCAPGFAKWEESYAHGLKNAAGIVMVVDQDKVKPDGTLGAGQAAAVAARNGFRAVGLKVRTVMPAAGKDLTDHVRAGYGVDDFVVDKAVAVRPRGLTAAELVQQQFDPIEWAVHGLLSTGLTLFAAHPKAGKSWIALDIGAAVAAGGKALGGLEVTQGEVIYLAMEDTYRRLQSRLALLMGGDLSAVPEALELVPSEADWVGGEEGLANLTEWAEEAKNPKLVIVDTLGRLEPDMGEDRSRGAYSGNYAMMSRYHDWANDRNLALLMIHHDRKGDSSSKAATGVKSDPFSRISGTRGLTGAADTMWFLETIKEEAAGGRVHINGTLHVTGRDVEEQALEMRKVGPLWTCFDPPSTL